MQPSSLRHLRRQRYPVRALLHSVLKITVLCVLCRCRYATMVLASVMIVLGLNAKPDTGINSWARKEAVKELKAEGIAMPRAF